MNNSAFQNPKWNTPRSAIEKLVVIASSAGGINALTQVLSGLPADLAAAILVVQHLKADRQTRLHEYLTSQSPFQTCLARDGMSLEAGVVYVALPGKHIRIENGHIVLSSEEPVNYVRPSADVLFASAAESFGGNVIGIVLSGTGRDGARGCQEIKAKGGMTIAQNEATSRYFDMPKAAIDAEVIDYVLPVQEIAGKIMELLKLEI
jgi:two-component system chemotaxis response regulator CheB